jgi:ABC-type multidrug transport system fused ATPase/permease subunit
VTAVTGRRVAPEGVTGLSRTLVRLDDRFLRWVIRQRTTATTVFRVERRLLGVARPYRKTVMLGLTTTMMITLVGLAKPWPTKILIDDALGAHSFLGLHGQDALLLSVFSTILLFLLSGGLGLLQTALLFGLSQRLIADLRERTFAHLTRVSLHYHDTHGTGDSIFRVTKDTYAVQTVLLDGLVPLAAAFLSLVGALVVLIAFDPFFALLSAVSVPAAFVLSKRFTARINKSAAALQQKESDVYSQAEQALGGIRTVQAHGREAHETARFSRRTGASRRAMMRLVTDQTLFGLAIDFVLGLGLGLVTYVAAERALSGAITPGEVLVVVAYAGTLYGPMSGIASTMGELRAAAAAAERVFEVLDQPHVVDKPHAPIPAQRTRGRLSFENVCFDYVNDHPVLQNVSFEVEPGQLIALVGPTGAGKSTMASLLLRLYDPRSGRVTLDGIDLRDVPLEWLREQISFVPQEALLFSATLRENIRYGRLDATDDEIFAAAQAANLDELLADPRGLDLMVGGRGQTLSGGQRQRVAIARAMLKDAPVLVLDEPTSALDASTEVLVMDALQRLFSGRTAIAIAHRLSTVYRADQVLVVSDGQIVQRGTHAQLSRQNGLYRRLHRARFGRQKGSRDPIAVPWGAT